METEGGGDGEQSGSNSAPTKASGQPSDYLAERQQRLNVSWNVGVRARNAGGDASMMRGRPSFGMDGWEVEEEQRKDMSSSLVSHLGSPMVHGTGVSPPPQSPGGCRKAGIFAAIPPLCLSQAEKWLFANLEYAGVN